MKSILISVTLFIVAFGVGAQTQMRSDDLGKQLLQVKNLHYENITFIGDLVLPNESLSVETGVYPENGESVLVFTNFVNQSVSFRDCIFKGRVFFFRKSEEPKSIKEYRVEFSENVVFENCIFENEVDFELTNFNKTVSFKGSIFKEQPRIVRMGIYQKPNVDGLNLVKGCLFQFDQSKKEQIFSTEEFEKVLEAMN